MWFSVTFLFVARPREVTGIAARSRFHDNAVAWRDHERDWADTFQAIGSQDQVQRFH